MRIDIAGGIYWKEIVLRHSFYPRYRPCGYRGHITVDHRSRLRRQGQLADTVANHDRHLLDRNVVVGSELRGTDTVHNSSRPRPLHIGAVPTRDVHILELSGLELAHVSVDHPA